MSNDATTTIIFARQSRRRCIEELRRISTLFSSFSACFAAEIPLLDEYLTDELRALASEGADICDEHLDLDALKTLWQFVYISRSEALRNYAICHREECEAILEAGSW